MAPVALAAAMVMVLCAGTAWAAAEAAQEAAPNPGDLGQAIAAILIFLALLAVLGKYGWTPIMEQLRRREEHIAKAIDDAQKGRQDAEALLSQYRAKLDQAAGEAKEVIAKGRQEAAAAREEILAQARDEARKAAEMARQDIEQAKQKALEELYQTTTELAADMAGRVLQESLKASDHRELLADSLSEIRKNAAKERQWPSR
jgi:F-type H+-transporting ATPase subunit b